MGNEVVQFNMDDVKKRIEETIKASFVMMMPEDSWKALVNKEIYNFMQPDTNYNKNSTYLSPLSKLIIEELMAFTRIKIQQELNQPEWQGTWESVSVGGKTVSSLAPSEIVRSIIQENMAQFIIAAHGGLVQQIVQNMRNGSY